VNVLAAEVVGELCLQVGAVNTDGRRAEFLVQVTEIGSHQEPAAPRSRFALSDGRSDGLDGLPHAELPQHLHRVGPQSDSSSHLVQLRGTFVNRNIPPRLLERDGCRQPPDAPSDDHRTRHKRTPERKLGRSLPVAARQSEYQARRRNHKFGANFPYVLRITSMTRLPTPRG